MITVDGVRPRQIFIGEKSAFGAIPRTHDDKVWRLLDIHSGIPKIYPQTAEAFILQAINLDLIDGLSFTKGCYPGQEIIARLRYRGKVKQRMIAGIVTDIENLAPGDSIHTQQRADQKAGLVVDAVQTDEREYTFSAIAPAGIDENSTLLVGADSTSLSALSHIPLPYAGLMKQSR